MPVPPHNFGYHATGRSDAIDGEHVLHCGLAVILAIVLHDAIVKGMGWLGYWINLGY